MEKTIGCILMAKAVVISSGASAQAGMLKASPFYQMEGIAR